MNMQNFTINASSRLAEAQSLANTLRNSEINSLHLFMSMLEATDSIIWDILSNLQIDKFNLTFLSWVNHYNQRLEIMELKISFRFVNNMIKWLNNTLKRQINKLWVSFIINVIKALNLWLLISSLI